MSETQATPEVSVVEKLEARIAELEAAFKDVKAAKGIAGARGPQGNHDTAAIFATKAAIEATKATHASTVAQIEEAHKRGVEKISAVHDSIETKQKSFQDNVENELAHVILKILVEYHLLTSDNVQLASRLACSSLSISNRVGLRIRSIFGRLGVTARD